MAPKSLSEMASAVATKNIKSIISIGDLHFPAVRHILIKIDSAAQLRRIELNCPQLQGETGELWLRLIEKDFPLELKANGYKPKSEDKWYKVWSKYKAEHDHSLQASEEQLRAAFMGLQKNKEQNTSKIVEGRFLPQDAIRHKKRNTGPKDNTSSVFNFGAGSRTKTLTAAGVMRKARREAKEVRNIQGALSRSVTTPIRVLERQHLKAPPPAMVREARIAAQPAFRTPEAEKREQHIQEMEKRRSATLSAHALRAAYITDSEDENSDEDEAPPPRKATKKPSAPPPPARAQPVPAASQAKLSAPARKLPGSGGSMFQRKFAPGKGTAKVSPPKPLRTTNTTVAAAQALPTGKKRTNSEANLDAGPSTPTKRPATGQQPALVSPELSPLTKQRSSSQEIRESLSPNRDSSPPKAVPRKKKTVNIFMKRPVKRT
ncbi:RNA polymerase II transcription factor SIII (Elongin) subunit A [Akanthomyces lecanii RCEF 1005]|uniref:RNA polymerase II transcription factor SIII (Elongin) subunit A n=2 Tax=Akanthomyces TaxID=150366 RepID=A0A168JM79_CORDF|nr:RNA polymerase II transcription factor SIII (Elongin) subunit A [Akanthomyces lecanii RCEF 1005]